MQTVRVYENNRLNIYKDIKYDLEDSLHSLINKYDSSLSSDQVRVAAGKSVFNDLSTKVQTALFYGSAISIYNYMLNLTVIYKSRCAKQWSQFKLNADSRKHFSWLKNLIEGKICNFSHEKQYIRITSIKCDKVADEFDHDQSLISLGIKDGSNIHVIIERQLNEIDTKIFLFIKSSSQIDVNKVCLSKYRTVETIKSMVNYKTGIPIAKQRIIFGRQELENEFTLAHYNIINKSTIHLDFTFNRGGGFDFSDINGDPSKFQWNSSAPKWRIAKAGLCLEGRCTNISCEAYKRSVIMNMGLPIIYQLGMTGQMRTTCPMCASYVKPITCGFNNCEWRFMGIKETSKGLERVMCDFKHVQNEYHRFNDDEKSLVSWSSLVIETKNSLKKNHLTNEDVCAFCLEEIEATTDINSKCAHKFHQYCLSISIQIKTECSFCKLSWMSA